MATIFVTGATGTIGSDLCKMILEQTSNKLIILIHQQGKDVLPENIIKKYFSLKNTEKYLSRITLVQGDITQKQLGLTTKIQDQIASEITQIIHSAASTRFDLPLNKARVINLFGTENVLKFALKCRGLGKFGFLSTVYVSGKRTGQILETELNHQAGFVNTYEQSKYQAEQLIKDYTGQIPITIYRLSTVIGNSSTGQVKHFTAPHLAIRMMYLGLASMLPGQRDYSVDLISTDYTSQTIFQLFNKTFKPCRTYHIAHGPSSYSLQELIDQTYKLLGKFDPHWAKRDYPKPAVVNRKTFDLFMKSAISADNLILKNTLTALNKFAHQLTYPKQFDQQNLMSDISNYRKKLPPINTYYGKVIKYCIKTGWGKKNI